MARETVHIEGLDTLLRRLKALGPAASKRGGPVRAAVRKAAVVIVKEAQANIDKIIATPNIGGQDYSTGLMRKSIKPVRAKAPIRYKGETFFVLIPKRIRYPFTKRNPTGIRVETVAAMLEYGTVRRPGAEFNNEMRWIRPAFHAKKDEAVRVMVQEMEKGLSKLERDVVASVS